MTFVKVGDMPFEATPFDLNLEAARMRHGTSTLAPYVQALVKHFDQRASQKLVSFKCPDGPWTRHAVNEQFQHLIKQDFRLVAVDPATGQPSDTETQDLLTAIVQSTGLADVNAFGQELDKQFGRHIKTVPRDYFVQKWGKRYSFDIHALVRQHVVELEHIWQDKRNILLLSIPFEVEYLGMRTFDCQTGQPMLGTDIESPLPTDLQVRNKGANTSLKPRLKQELHTSKGMIDVFTSLRDLHRERMERLPDDPKWEEQARKAQDAIDRAKQDVERRKARLDEMGG